MTVPSEPTLPVGRGPRCGQHAWRRAIARTVGFLGLAGYNWWIVVAVNGRLLTSPNELFSDLEAVGRPDASLLSDVDLLSGAAILVATLLIGRPAPRERRRREWWLIVVFAVAAMLGGLFPYVCPEGLSAACRSAEWSLRLPWRHYVHVIAGIVEFGSVSFAALLAWRRTRHQPGVVPGIVRGVVTTLTIGYPLLALSYVVGRLGVFVEATFFVSFSLVVAVELCTPR